MNILYVITQADGGGAQNYVLALARRFGGQVAAGNEAHELFGKANALGLETYELRHLKRDISLVDDFLAMWEIRHLVQTLKPDIVHLNSTKAGILGSFACVGVKTKVVFTAHGFIFNEPMSWVKKSFYLALEKTASAYRKFIIAVSEADRTAALNNNLIAPDKITVIHNGIKPILFLPKEEAREKLDLPSDKIIIGTLANFYKTKGLDVLIQAIGLLSDNIKSKIIVMIIGDGSDAANLKLEIRNLKLENQISLPGNIPDASKYLSALDIFILSSRKEGFPYSILEAMRAGLPIIATNVGGVPEALGDTGILIEPENPQLMAEKLTRLINDPSLQKTLGQKAQLRAQNFTEEKMLQATEQIYKKLLT